MKGLSKERRFGQRFAKEVGMGDPAEENDPPPESQTSFTKAADQVNRKCVEYVTNLRRKQFFFLQAQSREFNRQNQNKIHRKSEEQND